MHVVDSKCIKRMLFPVVEGRPPLMILISRSLDLLTAGLDKRADSMIEKNKSKRKRGDLSLSPDGFRSLLIA